MNVIEIKEEIKEILKGIDKDSTYNECGWWETSTGVEFGKQKLKEVLNVLSNLEEQPISNRSNK